MATHSDPQPNTETASRASLADRKGYNERFLGPSLPLPLPADSGTETVVLPYANFSVVFRPDRRLAVATAVTIDGAHLIDVPREDEWRFDPRLPEAQQAGHPIYKDNRWTRDTWSADSTPYEVPRRPRRTTTRFTTPTPRPR
ncbi:DNA/RNA non-specific endonuclease [Streptomyces sp. NPDC005336]|uniref:DNA/RNA non-specific endonuclease n=1 Tax=Streptomyces sp. NPDC005336 TaxID=3157035 RepID=UPI0033B14C6F